MTYRGVIMPDIMGIMDIAFPNLGIYLKNVPKSFDVFGYTIALYGVIIACGMLLGITLASRIAPQNNIKSDNVWDFIFIAIILGVIGARVYYIIFRWDDYKDNILEVFNIRNGGLAIYGGLIVGFSVLFIYCHKHKIRSLDMCDTVVPGIALGQAIGRWGNFTNREVFGEYTDNLFAMRLPVDMVRQSDISESIASHMSASSNYIQVHPTFLYESMWNLGLMLVLILFTKHKKFSGQVLTLYMFGYGLGRFIIEGIRTDVLYIGHTHIAASQVVCVVIMAGAVIMNVAAMIFKRNPQ